jgi:hypothetical protein
MGGPHPLFAGQPWDHLDILVVKVETDDDLVGWGEAFGHTAIPTRANADASWANIKQPIKPALLLDQHELQKAYGKGMKVLNHKRMIALQMVSSLYSAFERAIRTERPQKTYVRPISKEMIDRTAVTLSATPGWTTQPHKSNTFDRCWKTSQPTASNYACSNFRNG